ncbi:MAG: KOW motif-containing protein, partial [Candidatus Nanohaloarchaea archaeon]
EDEYDTGSSLLVTLPGLEIEKEVRMEEGNLAYVKAGKHVGEVGEVREVEEVPGSRPNTVVLEGEEGEFQTVEGNVYMVGEDEPEVDIGE